MQGRAHTKAKRAYCQLMTKLISNVAYYSYKLHVFLPSTCKTPFTKELWWEAQHSLLSMATLTNDRLESWALYSTSSSLFKKVQTQHWNSITLNYSIPTINHISHKTLIFQRAESYFYQTQHEQFLAPVSSAWTHSGLFSDSRLHFWFSAGPESEPQGWSLITREWAANSCLHRFTTPDPHTTLRVSMTTCSGVARGLLVGSEWSIMIGRRAWPRCFLRHLTRHTAY